MNRLFWVTLVTALALSIISAAPAPAQTVTDTVVHTPTVKIGWMNVDQAIMTCSEGAQILASIERFVESKRKEIDDMKRDAEDMRNKLEIQASRLTDEALLELEEKARATEVNLQRISEDAQRDVDSRRQRMYATISAKMGPIIEKVSIAKGLDAVMIFNPQRDAWINPGLNVTDAIIEAYDQAYPPGGPTMPSAAKKP